MFPKNEELQKQIWNDLHEISWGDASNIDAVQLCSQFSILLKEWDSYLGKSCLYGTVGKIIEGGVILGDVAPIIFDCIDPLYSFTIASGRYCENDFGRCVDACWYSVDGILIGLGSALVDFDWVEPWAHGRNKSTNQYLNEFREISIKNGVRPELVNSLVGLSIYMSVVEGRANGADSSLKLRASAMMHSMPHFFCLALAFRRAQNKNVQDIYELWRAVPSQVIERAIGQGG